MSENDQRNRAPALPTLQQWRDRVKHHLRSLTRNAATLEHLATDKAPADLNKGHVDYWLRPSLVGLLVDTVASVANALYQVEIQARYRGHRDADQADLQAARKHLTHAAQCLYRIKDRAGRTP